MSRIGNKPIAVPAGVEIKIDGHKVTVKGSKGIMTDKAARKAGLGGEVLAYVW